MKLIPLEGADAERRDETARAIRRIQDAGICPTCRNQVSGEIFPAADDRTYYEDDAVSCFLEMYPRNPGHTIVLVKRHLEDISELAGDDPVYLVIASAIKTLKSVLGAEKVYLCTMCDGPRNHLHFQLIPRLPGDEIRGSKLFVKPRMLLTQFALDMDDLRLAMRANM